MSDTCPQATPRVTDQRLQRLCLWLALMAARFAAHVLGAVAPQMAALLLKEYERGACNVLILRAVRRAGIKAPCRGSVPVEMRRLRSRGVVGAALRRALRRKTLADRARALCTLLADADRWIALIARRLKRGFTKRRILPKPQRAHLSTGTFAPSFAAPLPLNSS
jgi:hypothetical protein